MRKVAVIAGIMLAAVGSGWANGGERFPFHVGEKLTYQIFWGPFVVGRASLEVKGIEQVDGHDCYYLVARAKTSGLAEMLFPVDSTTESWLDVQGLFTRRYRQNRSEGKTQRDDDTHYDYQSGEAITRNHKSGVEKRMPLTEPVQDVVSSLYYVRTRPLKMHADQTFTVNASDANYSVHIRPDQRKVMWLRPVGDVKALRIEPSPTLKIVAAHQGRMWFWVSDDLSRLPLIVVSDLKIGSAKLVLYKVESANPVLDKAIGKGRPTVATPLQSGSDPLTARH